jgi:hypothetical protein
MVAVTSSYYAATDLQELSVPLFEECVRCVVGSPASLIVRFASILLFFPVLFGGVVLAARHIEKGKLRDRAIVANALVSPILLIFMLGLTTDRPARYSPLVLHQGAFKWPEGCVKREYRDGDAISIACHDYRNSLPRELVFDHGFPGLIERTEHDYFRVGDEAINFACNYFTQKCTVRHAEHNVFQ